MYCPDCGHLMESKRGGRVWICPVCGERIDLDDIKHEKEE